MDTEPPTGDDLTRMTVSIKENVLRRIGDEPAPRSRFRFGVVVGIVAVLAVGTASSAVALGLVPHPFAAPAPVASAPPTEAAPEPEPTVSPAAPAPTAPSTPAPADLVVPESCGALVGDADAGRLFGATPLVQLRPTAPGATPADVPLPRVSAPAFYRDAQLACQWQDPRSDVSYLRVTMGTATPDETADNLTELAGLGYSCGDVSGGQSCQRVSRNDTYPVDDASTFFVRRGTWIQINQTNFPTSDLLGAIVDHVGG